MWLVLFFELVCNNVWIRGFLFVFIFILMFWLLKLVLNKEFIVLVILGGKLIFW